MAFNFHLGYPKAGSTTLQRNVFLPSSKINYLGLNPRNSIAEPKIASGGPLEIASLYNENPEVRELYDLLLNCSAIKFDYAKARMLWKTLLGKYGTGGWPLVFSHEGFLSARFQNPAIYEKLAILKELINDEDVRFLILIRNQSDLLQSLYRDWPFDPLTFGVRQRAVTFDEWWKIDSSQKYHSHTISLDYYSVVDTVQRLFGDDSVVMVPLELAIQDPGRFSSMISLVTGVGESEVSAGFSEGMVANHGITESANRYRIFRSRMAGRLTRVIPGRVTLKRVDQAIENHLKKIGGKAKVEVSNEIQSVISDFYRAGNAGLSERIGIDLGELGYPV